MKKTLIRISIWLCSSLVLVYVGALILLYTQQEKMLFFPTALNTETAQQYSEYAVSFNLDEHTLQGWFIAGESEQTIVYYGGNRVEISRRIQALRNLGSVNYLLMNYRGYGDSTGAPSEQALKEDAMAILAQASARFNFKLEETVLIGRSLGTGVAAHVAANSPVKGLVLVTPYDSILNISKDMYPFFPVATLLKHPFNTLAYVDQISIPTLFIKAETDRTVEHRYSDNLIENWRSPMQLFTLSGTHNSVVRSASFNQTVTDFIEKL